MEKTASKKKRATAAPAKEKDFPDATADAVDGQDPFAPNKRQRKTFSVFDDENEVAGKARGTSIRMEWRDAEDRDRAGDVLLAATDHPELIPERAVRLRLRWNKLWNYQVSEGRKKMRW
jgi:hypothetical protein